MSDNEIRINISLWKVIALIKFIEIEYLIQGGNRSVEKFLKDLLSELNKRFPVKGLKLPAFVLGHFFHPFFHKHLLNVDDENIQKLIDNHLTTKEYLENSPSSGSIFKSNNAGENSDSGNL